MRQCSDIDQFFVADGIPELFVCFRHANNAHVRIKDSLLLAIYFDQIKAYGYVQQVGHMGH